MADKKITDLDELTSIANGDILPIVDVSDLTDDPAGSSRKITTSNLFNNLQSQIDSLVRSPFVVVGFDNTCDYICDGTSDNIKIQEAIDYLSATGGSVILKTGTYDIATPLIINHPNISLQGLGWGTYLKLHSDSNCGVIHINSDSVSRNGQIIRDLYIDGNVTNNTSVTGYEDCIWLNTATNALIENCKLVNAVRSGIRIDEGSDNRIFKNRIESCGDNSENPYAGIIAGSPRIQIKGNNIYNCIKDGIALADTTYYAVINGNICNTNGQGNDVSAGIGAGSGIYLSDDCCLNIISNNVCVFHKNSGIDLDNNSNDNQIIGNVCKANYRSGIIVSGSANKIIGNHSKDNGTESTGYLDGITLIGANAGEGKWNIVQGNWCSGHSSGYGLETVSNSDYNVITGNIFVGNDTNINLVGVNDVNQHNITS